HRFCFPREFPGCARTHPGIFFFSRSLKSGGSDPQRVSASILSIDFIYPRLRLGDLFLNPRVGTGVHSGAQPNQDLPDTLAVALVASNAFSPSSLPPSIRNFVANRLRRESYPHGFRDGALELNHVGAQTNLFASPLLIVVAADLRDCHEVGLVGD